MYVVYNYVAIRNSTLWETNHLHTFCILSEIFNVICFFCGTIQSPLIYCISTVWRAIFEGGNFCEFHESSLIRENFILEVFLFQLVL